MTAIKVNTPTSPTALPNSPGYCSKLIAWCRKNPKKTVVVFIIVLATVYIGIHVPFHKRNLMLGLPTPESLGDHGSGINDDVK